jgi:hypothetical protein
MFGRYWFRISVTLPSIITEFWLDLLSVSSWIPGWYLQVGHHILSTIQQFNILITLTYRITLHALNVARIYCGIAYASLGNEVTKIVDVSNDHDHSFFKVDFNSFNLCFSSYISFTLCYFSVFLILICVLLFLSFLSSSFLYIPFFLYLRLFSSLCVYLSLNPIFLPVSHFTFCKCFPSYTSLHLFDPLPIFAHFHLFFSYSFTFLLTFLFLPSTLFIWRNNNN